MPVIARTSLIIDWITQLGWDIRQELGAPLLPGPEIVNTPDMAVFITGTGGSGYVTEEAGADARTFQARVRGPADDPLAAERLAQELDTLILTAPFPVSVDGIPVQHAHRLAGPPVFMPLDPSDRRFQLTCDYVIITGSAG